MFDFNTITSTTTPSRFFYNPSPDAIIGVPIGAAICSFMHFVETSGIFSFRMEMKVSLHLWVFSLMPFNTLTVFVVVTFTSFCIKIVQTIILTTSFKFAKSISQFQQFHFYHLKIIHIKSEICLVF